MSKFEESKTSGAHFKLSQIAGDWQGTTSVYFDETDNAVDASPSQGTIKSILGGRFMMHEYSSSMQGKPLEGIAIYGNQLDSGKFQCAWIDSFHTGTSILFSEDKQPDKLFSVIGNWAAGDEIWGWRTEIEMPDNDTLIIKMKNYTPAGEAAGGVTTNYKRKT
jgi:hypothetical protein